MSFLKKAINELGLSRRDVDVMCRTAPFRYKVYQIEKKSGGKRTIAQPTAAVKDLQRVAIRYLQDMLPVSDYAFAYREGLGIKHNASAHAGNSHLLKMDFENFFNSITPDDLTAHLDRYAPGIVEREEVLWLERLLFWSVSRVSGLRLSVGAPSSPFISNSIMYDFDIILGDEAQKYGITYTRYADDLTLSSKSFEDLSKLASFVHLVLPKMHYPVLSVNESKTVYISKRYQRRVTGLVLANDGRVTVGRHRKRIIRSQLHKNGYGQLNLEERNELRGWLAFLADVEPDYHEVLRMKYSKSFQRLGEGEK